MGLAPVRLPLPPHPKALACMGAPRFGVPLPQGVAGISVLPLYLQTKIEFALVERQSPGEGEGAGATGRWR